MQEAFIKLWEQPLLWDAQRKVPFTAWFTRVVINRCLDYQKKKRPVSIEDASLIVDDRESNEIALIRRQKQQQLEAHIKALPERQRIALNLCFYEEMSNQEAATVMNIHLKALQSLLIRAKTALRNQLKENGEL